MKRLHFIIYLSLLTAGNMFAQTDMRLWTEAQLEAPITKDLKVALNGQMRFDQNISRVYKAFLAPSINYDVIKYVRVGAEYRFMRVPVSSDVSNRISTHRYTIDVEFRKIMDLFTEKSRLDASIRVRGTAEFEPLKRTDNYLRYRLKLEYNLPKTKLEPFISGELWHHINDELTYTFTEVTSSSAINRYRLQLGANYPIDKHKVGVFGMLQKDIFGPDASFTLGVGYTYELDQLLKK